MQGLFILREFNFSQISKRRSEDLCEEFMRLEELRLQTTMKYGSEGEIGELQRTLHILRGGGRVGMRKAATNDNASPRKKVKA